MLVLNRTFFTRIIFTVYLLLFIYKYANGALLSQNENPLFTNPAMNLTYWVFLYSDFNNFIFNHPVILIMIDWLLLSSCILIIIKPKLTICAFFFTIAVWLYQLLYCQILSYQPFGIGLLFACIPFIYYSESKFKLVFEAGRYFICGLYGLGGLLKLINKGIFSVTHLSDSLKITVTDFILSHPYGLRSQIMIYFIENPKISFALYVIVVIMELSFICGFFTKKYDLQLLIIFFVFHTGNAILMDIPLMNHFIIAMFLLPSAINQNENYFKFESSPN